MLQKKICLLGAFGVGKTSLTRRFVSSIFSDAYLTTVGVKIDKKTLDVGTTPVSLVIWDIAEARVGELRQAGWTVERTSAKTGTGVEEAFAELAKRIVG